LASQSSSSVATTLSSASDCEEAVLLRDWDFERFFPNSQSARNSSSEKSNSNTPPKIDRPHSEISPSVVKNGGLLNNLKLSNNNNNSKDVKNNLALIEKKKMEEISNKIRLEERVKSEIIAKEAKSKGEGFLSYFKGNNDKINAKPNSTEADKSKGPMNFVRGFRRENSDFFPMSKRHSAILGEQASPAARLQQQPQAQQRSSAIFQRNRTKGEPILTDFVKNRDDTLKLHQRVRENAQQQPQQQTPVRAPDFLRPRREKTESVIQYRNSTTRQLLLEQQQVKKLYKLKIEPNKKNIICKIINYKKENTF
jgi:TRAF2 and NCK interacting kinase